MASPTLDEIDHRVRVLEFWNSWSWSFVKTGAILILFSHLWALNAPLAEASMGETGRILYVHVPTAWIAMVIYFWAFWCACAVLWTGKRSWDHTQEGCLEVGVVLNIMLLFQGSIWAKPTWGTYWTWDPRLTSSAVMAISFAGILVLRRMMHNPEKRIRASAVATIIAFMNVPIVYFCVNLLPSIHQMQSSPQTVDTAMHWPLRAAAFGFLFLGIGLVGMRARSAARRMESEDERPDFPPVPEKLNLENA